MRASVRDYSGNEGIGPREIRYGCCRSRSRSRSRCAAAFALGVHVFQRPHFDAAEACPREVAGDAHGFVAVAGDDQVEAGQQFAGFGEGAIQYAAVAITHAQGLRGVDRLQLLRGQQRAFGLQLVGMGQAVAHQRVEFFDGQGLQQGRLDRSEQVLLHGAVLAGAVPMMAQVCAWACCSAGGAPSARVGERRSPPWWVGLVAESWLPAVGRAGIGGTP